MSREIKSLRRVNLFTTLLCNRHLDKTEKNSVLSFSFVAQVSNTHCTRVLMASMSLLNLVHFSRMFNCIRTVHISYMYLSSYEEVFNDLLRSNFVYFQNYVMTKILIFASKCQFKNSNFPQSQKSAALYESFANFCSKFIFFQNSRTINVSYD